MAEAGRGKRTKTLPSPTKPSPDKKVARTEPEDTPESAVPTKLFEKLVSVPEPVSQPPTPITQSPAPVAAEVPNSPPPPLAPAPPPPPAPQPPRGEDVMRAAMERIAALEARLATAEAAKAACPTPPSAMSRSPRKAHENLVIAQQDATQAEEEADEMEVGGEGEYEDMVEIPGCGPATSLQKPITC